MKKIYNIRKFLAGVVLISLISTSIVITNTAAEGNTTNDMLPSLRIYGEKEAVYPTQSYYGSQDFVYPKEYDPFDPGIIEKDSITFNAAYWFGHDEYEIKARGDASEKIFLRAFYEPGYTHPVDCVMNGCQNVLLKPVETFDAIVTETTYSLVTLYDREPNYGYPGETKFVLPYASMDPAIPGMEEAGLLDVADTNHMKTKQLTDGAIEVEKEYTFNNIDYKQDLEIRFMDHMVKIENFEDNDPEDDKLDIYVWYIGNMNDRIPAEEKHTIWENSMGPDPSNNYYFNRENHKLQMSDACHRWYLRIENADDDYLRLTVGRRLVAGETFYVDGVRYDIPAVYVASNGGFKYITLQSPIPKGEPIWESVLERNVDDFSHVTSQYLASLPKDVTAWLLPPFNEPHTMIDDIGLEKPNPHTQHNCLHPPGKPLDGLKDPLVIKYIDETIEDRFSSSLLERLNTDRDEDEEWYWYNVYTKPNRYTEFVLPDQEKPTENYPNSLAKADGFEYLVTTSLIAPNSKVDLDRSDRCKDYDEHEIFDRVLEIARFRERAEYYEMPRFVFEFDAYDDTDFFINEGTAEPSVRLYGEQDFVYPTQSYTGADDFVYDREYYPFDPGVIKKDSITFNSAFIDGHAGVYEIKAQGDASEKMFLRAFYEPGYTHPVDTLMNDCSNVILKDVEQFDAIVTETTYFLVTIDGRQPTVGNPYPEITKVVLPYKSSNPFKPGMEMAGLLDVAYTDHMETKQLTDGSVSVEMEFEFNDDSFIGTPMHFMDHKLTVVNFEDNDPDQDKLDLKVAYIGNMNDAISAEKTYTLTEDLWGEEHLFFDRENNWEFKTDACHRWYMNIQNADDDYLRLTIGRKLVAGETFYVDGVRYDMPAVYVDSDGGFKYITFQTPIPKGHPVWQLPLSRNVDDFSHVTSQYLASLPMMENAWLLPPFNDKHTMIDDIGLKKMKGNCLPAEGVMLRDEKGPIDLYYIEESVEERFETSIVERLHTDYGEHWYWYNVYTRPNRYTEFVLPNQETTNDYYNSNDLSMTGYSYSKADGNEYLITNSLIAPNSEMDLKRGDKCKKYDHEIFSPLGSEDSVFTESAQLCMIIDGSGSISPTEWNLMIEGIADAVRNNMPHDGSVEFTVVQFSDNLPDNAQVEIGPIVVDNGNYENIATQVENINQEKGFTPLAAGINKATEALLPTVGDYTRQIINIVTDGVPNIPGGESTAKAAAVTARNDMIDDLGMDPDEDEIDAEGIGISSANIAWLRDNIVWPQPGYDTWPPIGPGWVRAVTNFEEFSTTIGEKFDILFVEYAPRFAFEFDAHDGTGLYINNYAPPTFPPTAVACTSEGYSGNCVDPVMFDGSDSHDNDEGGDTIVKYRWDFTNDGTWDTGWLTVPTGQYVYTTEGDYTVKLEVMDDEDQTDTDTAPVTIRCEGQTSGQTPTADAGGPYFSEQGQINFDGSGSHDNDEGGDSIVSYAWTFGDGNSGTGMTPSHTYLADGDYTVTLTVTDDEGQTDTDTTTACIGCVPPAQIIMNDVDLPDSNVHYAYLEAKVGAFHVGSIDVDISWDPTEVTVVSVDDYDFDSLEKVLDTTNGELSIIAWMSGGSYLAGDFNIARIGFQAVGSIGCDLVIEESELLDDAVIANAIPHITTNGYANIINNGPALMGNMDGSGAVNVNDVRYLALHLLGESGYENIHGCNPNVNCNGGSNAADVRYLALHIAGDPNYAQLYPGCNPET